MDDFEKSLSDEATFAGRPRPQRVDVSIGDERTLGDGLSGQDTIIDDIEVVDLAARYKIETTIGRGGMGEVLLALDTRLDRKVAIKRILGEAARSKTAVSRFLTEAKSIAALNHSNIVQIYEFGRAKDGPFLIMEYVDGGSLSERCKAGPIALEKAIELACQICNGLAKAHDQGIIHRDIKPANVLLTQDGIPKLTDFGLAKDVNTARHMTVTGAVMGTPDFMPPEQQLDASLVDHRSDLWSLAATIYQMITGKSPKVIQFKGLTSATQDVLGKALEDEKEARYQSVREFRDALRGVVGGSRAPSSPSPPGAGGLQEGQCSACGTVNADLGRKFCRNPACGAPLRVPCLKCDMQIPVWDAVCGECGGNQPQLLAAMRTDLETMKAAVEANLAECLFDESLRAAEKIAATTLPQLNDLAQWARGFKNTIASERDRRMVGVAEQVKAARAHMAAFDYQAAIQSLELIPGPLLRGEASQVLADCRSLQEESQRLISEIGACIKRKEVDGLLPLVARAVELRGDRKDLQTIYKQLTDRRDAHVAKARAALELGDARQAASILARVSPKDCDDRARRLLTTVQQAADCETELAAAVQAAKADGEVSVEETRQILAIGERCLLHNPRNEKVRALVQQCNESLLKADVSRTIRQHGVHSIETARALTHQAISYLNQDKPELAEPLLKQAMQIVARLDAPDGDVKPLKASILHTLGVCYSNQGKHDEAEPLYGHAIVIREKLIGREDPLTVESIRDLAVCYHNQGKYEKAESLYEHVATIREKSLGRGHPETETSFRELAVCYQMQGKYAKAESLYERILEIQEMTVGAQESPGYDMTFFDLTNCYWQQGKVKEAESLLRRAIRLSDEQVGLEQPWLCRAIYELAHGLAHQGKHTEAEPLYRRALVIEEKSLGLEHPDTVVSISALAWCCLRQNKYDEAELLFTRALTAQETTLGSEHADTLSCRETLQQCRDVRAMSLLRTDLDEVTPERAEVLRYYSGILVLDAITSITPEAAAVLTRHSHGLSLGGLTDLAPAVAAALAEYQGAIFFRGLATLTNEVVDAFAAFRGVFLGLDGVRELSPQAAHILTHGKRGLWLGVLSLDGLLTPPLETLAALVQHDGILSLGGLESLTPETAAILSRHKGDKLNLDGIVHIEAEIAELLSKRERGLHLNGLKHLSLEASQSLWKCRGLGLNGLKEISPEVAECLARCDIGLGLRGLTEINRAVAERLANARCSVNLDGLRTLSPEAAESLGESDCGSFSLLGLNWLCKVAFDALQTNMNIALPDNLTVLAESRGFVSEPVTNSIGMAFEHIPAGTFTMGQAGRARDETPHRVKLTKPFYIGVCPVTNAQWKAAMGSVPSKWQDADRPVEQVSWEDATELCTRLSALPAEAKAGRVYRLPTEAEWEFACRAGTTTDFSFGDDGHQVGDYGWFRHNSGRVELDADSLLDGDDEDKDVMQLLENGCQTHPVGHKSPNAWGLFDMYGNVREWCSDWYGAYPEEPDVVFDPEGPTEGSFRVSRGGCWFEQGKWCRSASRHWNAPASRTAGLGLRLIFTQESPAEESRVLNNA